MALRTLKQLSLTPRRAPKAYKAKDAEFTVGGNSGFYVASKPRPYPKTPQQAKVAKIAAECGIKKGIKKAELQKKMVECVGPKMREKLPEKK